MNTESNLHSEIDGRLDLKVLPLTLCLYMVILGITTTWAANWFTQIQLGKAWGFLGLLLLFLSYVGAKRCFREFAAREHKHEHD